ncbi:Ppx/GppA phosphatase family protein [Breoghania sp. L-A4]|uniref:Ppx/GppA phosphatase family protein n=1 Tax=Breoghania sp. L-A4 TaxID=2304600 RepID=UPI000E36068E|nr:Ppx/GppA phosphatase family protein [Breoghania sp. L-A4]AXS40624.1 Ppx/GppA family phosphatase [Breoghania sp. L-A4]
MMVSDDAAPGRLPGEGAVAVIDIGSNSIRLVVYERLSRAPTVLFNEKVLAGLGRGVGTTNRLSDEAADVALRALMRFRQLCDQIGVVKLLIVATAAVRDAENGREFLNRVEDICGTTVKMLTGKDEAYQSALGVIAGMWKPDGIVGDLGGGSLELVSVTGREIGKGLTYPLGGIRLQEAAGGSIKKAVALVGEALEGADWLSIGTGRAFYAVGGTWRSLARLHMAQTGYPLHVIDHYSIEADEALEFCKVITHSDIGALDCIEVVSKQRRPLLPYGAAVLEQVIRRVRPSRIVMSALGVREGLLYDQLPEEEKILDPLLTAGHEFALLRARSPRHARELVTWTENAFSVLEVEETDEEKRLRTTACLLADIGWRAHPEYRGEQSLSIISNAAFTGVDHPGRAYLALAVYYRHAGPFDEALSPGFRELASLRLKERARTLGASLRVAYLITGSAPGIIGRTGLAVVDGTLELRLPPELGALDGERLAKRLSRLAKMFGLNAAIRVLS